MASTHTYHWLLVLSVLQALAIAQEDNRYVEVFPGSCNVTDDLIISKLEIHPQGDEDISTKITGILTLTNQLPCETRVYRYVEYWAPVGAIEMNATSSLDSAQSATGPELANMGLPTDCPVQPGDYSFEWNPPPGWILPGVRSYSRMIIGFDAFHHTSEKKFVSCRIHVNIKKPKEQ